MAPDHAELDAKLNLLIRAGVLMLENGAATYRVNETLSRIGQALDLLRVEVFATPTGLILEAHAPGGAASTRVARITALGVDMNRLARLSDLSREAVRE